MVHCKVCYRKENSHEEASLLTTLLGKNQKMTLLRWNASDNYCIENYFMVENNDATDTIEIVVTQGDRGRTCVHFDN